MRCMAVRSTASVCYIDAVFFALSFSLSPFTFNLGFTYSGIS